MKIQHNIPAMNSYRNYTNNVKAVAKNLEKLSSGYKINRAGDDAAGLAISEKMRAQITGLKTAQKNAKDGISLIQTAEGALTEVHSMLNRMFELAEQSANGTYDNEVDRANLQKEFGALRDEIDRIADSSNFNGQKLLDGSLTSNASTVKNGTVTNFTALTATGDATAPKIPMEGAHRTGTVLHGDPTTATKASFAIDFGDFALKATAAAATPLAVKIGGVSLRASADYTGTDIAPDLGTATVGQVFTHEEVMTALKTAFTDGITYSSNATTNFTAKWEGDKLTFTQTAGATDFINKKVELTSTNGSQVVDTTFNQNTIKNEASAIESAGNLANTFFTLDATIVKDGGQLTVGGTTYTFAMGAESKFKGGTNVLDLTAYTDAAATVNGVTGLSKAGELLSQQDNGVYTIGDLTGGTVSFEEKAGQKKFDLSTIAGVASSFGTGTATYTAAKGSALSLQIGDTADEYNMLKVDVRDMHAEALGIGVADINISEQGMSQTAMDAIKNAINSVSATRGDMGALQNRLDHTINNLGVMQENIQDAEANIRDTDIAEEMMAYTKNNILVQSAQAMLAQANQLPQGVLQLLG